VWRVATTSRLKRANEQFTKWGETSEDGCGHHSRAFHHATTREILAAAREETEHNYRPGGRWNYKEWDACRARTFSGTFTVLKVRASER
jgi:hypothetical protein